MYYPLKLIVISVPIGIIVKATIEILMFPLSWVHFLTKALGLQLWFAVFLIPPGLAHVVPSSLREYPESDGFSFNTFPRNGIIIVPGVIEILANTPKPMIDDFLKYNCSGGR